MFTDHFTEYEFVCRCGKCSHSVPHPFIVMPQLMTALQQARNILDSPIYVTSGRRCSAHNRAVGGVPKSYHTKGMAADVRADDMNTLAHALASVKDFSYIEIHDDYIHVDIGKTRNTRVVDKRTAIPLR